MTVRRMALQAAVGNLTQNQAITVDANGLLISAGLITYAYIQNVSATDKILGRATAGAGTIEEIACTAQGRAILALATGIDYAKLQNVSVTDKVLGRASAGAGVIEEIACTAAGRALIDDADAAAQRTTLGIPLNNIQITGGSIAGITDLAVADGGTGSSTAAAARLALGLVDATDRMPSTMHPTRELSHYFHASWDEVTQVAGTWVVATDGNQTDFDSSISATAGYTHNAATHANLDELHFGNLVLNAGTYKIVVAGYGNTNTPIWEVLIGNTSMGTIDSYMSGATSNKVGSITYSPTVRVSGNLRFRANGKNASSSNYYVYLSRLEIIRTA